MMIKLTRTSGKEFVLNADLIIEVQETPDTVITMNNGKKLLVKDSADDIINKVVDYILERFEYMLLEKGYSQEIIRSVISGLPPNIIKIQECCILLSEVRGEEEFKELVTAFNRIQNIVKNKNFENKNID